MSSLLYGFAFIVAGILIYYIWDPYFTGDRQLYYSDGRCIETFVSGVLKKIVHYHANLHTKKSIELYNGKNIRHGVCLWYYPSGSLKTRQEYVNGAEKGNRIEYYDCPQASPGKKKKNAKRYTSNLKVSRIGYAPPKTNIRSICTYEKSKLVTILHIYDKSGRDCVLGDGEVEVWKACRASLGTIVYVKLLVPSDAKRLTALDPSLNVIKSRVDKALVLDITDEKGNQYNKASSYVYQYSKMTYVKGMMVYPHCFNADPLEGCGAGINVHKYKDECNYWFRPILP